MQMIAAAANYCSRLLLTTEAANTQYSHMHTYLSTTFLKLQLQRTEIKSCMSDQSTNCQSLGFPKTNTRMQFPAATRSAIPKIYGSIVRSDHLLVKLISTSGAAVATAAAGGFDVQLGGWYCLGPMIIMLSSKLIGYWTFVDIVAIQMDGVVVWRLVSM